MWSNLRKSLYWKFVFVFVGGVTVSLVISYLVSSLFFQEDVILNREMERVSSYVEGLLEIGDEEDVPELLNLLAEFGVDPVLTDLDGEAVIANLDSDFVTPEMIDRIEKLDPREIISFTSSRREPIRYMGARLTTESEAEALFIKIDATHTLMGTRRLIMQSLLLVLVIGSLIIVLISRYFVSNIHSITDASEQLATGDFSVRLPNDRQDELGQLMRTFNEMAKALDNMDEVRKRSEERRVGKEGRSL